ncbi:phage major capsid protein [Bacillus sp. V2I10]|uniref:phage major capsid protein n=1 Tax=Bacillus sp. V2I10 TaxID=3042276 RepID=UPI00277F957A|nr:phage major capsid protein [Bacillus sp. V2I10]MDQ0861606.1 HK97 family phage major capsid protein [Bacillus sp. V2I10]
MTAEIADTSWGRDYYELINSGILRNMSFGFRTISDSWKPTASGIHERTIEELELFEISVVRDPAYSDSTISARGIDIVEADIPTEVEVEIQESEERELPIDVRVSKLKLSIAKQEEEVRRAEKTLNLSPTFKFILINEKEKLSELNEEFRQLKNQMEEIEMKNEERALQTKAVVGNSASPKLVDSIVKKLESTSSVFSKSRKIPFNGEEMKIPYETALVDAVFLDEGSNAPEIAFNLSNLAVMNQRRVAVSISMSKQYMFDSGVDLSQHARDLVARRVLKRIEKSIMVGNAANEFKGIAPDSNVTSKNISLGAATQLVNNLRSVYFAVHEDFVGTSSWYMSRPFFEKVVDFKDSDGNFYVKQIELNGKIVYTLFGAPIEISNALSAGDTIGQVPVLFGSIEDCYTVGVSKDLEVKDIAGTPKVLAGSVGFLAEFYGDGRVHNYQAIAKGTISS